MPNSFMKNRKGKLHHPEIVRAGATLNGRYLEPKAVAAARTWRMNRYKELSKINILSMTFKERHLWRRLELEFKDGVLNKADILKHARGPRSMSSAADR